MNFDWFLNPIKYKYADFTGRATVQEFWMFVLYYIIIYIGLLIVGSIVGLSDFITAIFGLIIIVPSIALTARRLHDTGLSGWWQLLGFIPLLGLVIIIVLTVKQGESGENAYGPDPRMGKSDSSRESAEGEVVHDVEVDSN